MKICIAGKNSIAIDTIKYLLNDLNLSHDNICIITNRMLIHPIIQKNLLILIMSSLILINIFRYT